MNKPSPWGDERADWSTTSCMQPGTLYKKDIRSTICNTSRLLRQGSYSRALEETQILVDMLSRMGMGVPVKSSSGMQWQPTHYAALTALREVSHIALSPGSLYRKRAEALANALGDLRSYLRALAWERG